MPVRMTPEQARAEMARHQGMQPESAILKQVRHYLQVLGWMVIRHQQSMGSHRGLADLTAIRHGRTIWIECKTAKGKQSGYQSTFQDELEAHGGEYRIVRGIEDVEDMGRDS